MPSRIASESPAPRYIQTLTLPENDKAFSNFIETLKTQATKDIYTWGLRNLASFAGVKTYSELLVPEDKAIEDRLIDWVKQLNRQEASNSKKNTYYMAVKHFFTINDKLDINWYKVKRFIVFKDVKRSNKGYTKKQITRILSVASIRLRVILLLAATAGLRVGAIRELKVKHLKPVGPYFVIKAYADTASEYPTVCTPQCAKAIQDLLTERKKKEGDELTKESYLVANELAPDLPMTYNSMSAPLRLVLKKVGFRDIGDFADHKRHEVPIFHGLRKFFDTAMINNVPKVDHDFKELMMGHSVDLDEVYWDTENPETIKRLIEEYEKVVPALTID